MFNGNWEATLVGLENAFTLDTASSIKGQLSPVLSRVGDVIVDIRGASLDSAGLGALLSLQRRLELQDRHLLVVGGNPEFLGLLERTGATDSLTVFADVEKATRYARSQALAMAA